VVGAEGIGTGTTEFIPLYVTMIKQQLQSIEPALQPGDQVHKTVSYAYSLTKAGDSAQNPSTPTSCQYLHHPDGLP
jgi:hypothetical protein